MPKDRLFLTILKGTDHLSAEPVLACEDQDVVRAAMRVIGSELGRAPGADAPPIHLVPPDTTPSGTDDT